MNAKANTQLSPVISTRIEHLRPLSVLQDIKHNDEALLAIAQILEDQQFSPNSDIIVEGTPGAEMFILISGNAAAFKKTPEGDSYKVAELRAEGHAVFGEGGLLGSDARSATIRANTACRCLILKRQAFMHFGEKHPQWALPIMFRIARVVMSRFQKTNNDLMLLYNALVSEIRGR